MDIRPQLTNYLNKNQFLENYYLKVELISFCKENKLPTSGNKQNITKRIYQFLSTGIIEEENIISYKPHLENKILTLDSIIEDNFVCSEKHRAFFKSIIGAEFSFNVEFQKYLKTNAGKTYKNAIEEWYKIKQDKIINKGNSIIDSQFEYNTYIRDFFKENPYESLTNAIVCWKYKKQKAGTHKYERSDLLAIQ